MQKHPSTVDISAMSAVEYNTAVARWARTLEDREAKRNDVPLTVARRRVARRIGVSPGTLESIRRVRIKGIRLFDAERIRAAIIREFSAEIEALTHELHLAMASGVDPRSNEIAAVEAALATARQIMKGVK